MSVNKDLETARMEAIFSCYGLTAMQQKKIVNINGEEISSWFIDGFLELENLQDAFTDEQIVDIYDSGI